MKRVLLGIISIILTGASLAQAPSIHPAFRLKLLEAVQDVDALNDPTSTATEEAMNRVQARRSVQELGRVALTPLEASVAAHVAQHLLSVRTCIFAESASGPDATKDCFDKADKERSLALKMAGIDLRSVYPH